MAVRPAKTGRTAFSARKNMLELCISTDRIIESATQTSTLNYCPTHINSLQLYTRNLTIFRSCVKYLQQRRNSLSFGEKYKGSIGVIGDVFAVNIRHGRCSACIACLSDDLLLTHDYKFVPRL